MVEALLDKDRNWMENFDDTKSMVIENFEGIFLQKYKPEIRS